VNKNGTLEVVTNELRVRQQKDFQGYYIDSWEVINLVCFNDGTVKKTLVCCRPSYAECMDTIKLKNYH
jgi:hypothetical protein